MLNVDNEVVSINETHVSFSGIGRQKPKRYVVDLELFAPIDPNRSTWGFGSVGTVKFVLRKATEGTWARLTASNESVKNHRVWWEKQEQVEKEDRKLREAGERSRKEAQEAEEKQKKQAEAEQRRAREKEREERTERRAQQKPFLAAAHVAATALVESDTAEMGEALGEALREADALLKEVDQHTNETAHATAEQMLNAIRSLRSTGFQVQHAARPALL